MEEKEKKERKEKRLVTLLRRTSFLDTFKVFFFFFQNVATSHAGFIVLGSIVQPPASSQSLI